MHLLSPTRRGKTSGILRSGHFIAAIWINMRPVAGISYKRERRVKQYKAVIYQEGMLGSLLLGASKVDPVRFTAFLNQNAKQGWRVVTMEKDIRRMLLLWRREGYIVIMEK